MSSIIEVNIGNDMYYSRCQIHLIAGLLCQSNHDLTLNERDLYALTRQLYDIDDCLEDVEKFLNSQKPPLIEDLKSTKSMIEEGVYRPEGALENARSAIEKIDQFLANDLKQIMALADEFKEIEKHYKLRLKKQIGKKKAPAKAEDLAEAPKVDQN